MNIQYVENLGTMNLTSVLSPTDDHSYYRTLGFEFPDFSGMEFDRFTQFLDDKIQLADIRVSGDAVVMIRHSADTVPERELIAHAITLLSARILICNSLRWTLLPQTMTGYRFEIILPVSEVAIPIENSMETIKRNEKLSFEKIPVKTGIWGEILIRLKLRKRAYTILVNGTKYGGSK